MKILSLLVVAGVQLLVSSAFAAQSLYLHQPRISTRVMGMGGAFTAVADDYQALYYNPAGLARLEAGQVVMDITPGITSNILGFNNDLKAAGSDANAITNTVANYFGSHFASRVGLGFTWARPHWAIGIQPVDLSIEADVHGAPVVSVGVQAYQDSVVQFGLGWNIGEEKRLSVGVAPKAVYRGYVEKDINAFDLVTNKDLFRPQDAQEGFTIDADVGMLYTFGVPEEGPFRWLQYARPTLGLAVRNVADYGFPTSFHLYSPQTSQNVAHLERRIDVGSRFDLPEFWVFKPRVMVDARDLGTRYASFRKCSHVGTELLWKAFGWLNGGYRLGVSEGYITAGVSAELGIFMLDVATYSEEIGTADSPRESRRYMAQLSLDF